MSKQVKQPVVVLVGHIDHGKSSILQKIKDFKITEKEVGGITQHIGAYEVEHEGKKITFIDTPGHEAFTAMRARGAKIADIAILVVAVDDGIKPQTKEAISHLKQADIPIIVALNKVDSSMADAERVKDQLSKEDILVEDRGGNVPSIKTSAKTGKGIQELIELILLVAEMQELKFNSSDSVKGVVIETFMCSKRGCVVTLLLEAGVLNKGDIVGTKSSTGKIKRIEDFLGKELEIAQAGQGVSVLGFENPPTVGENFQTYSSLNEGKENIEEKQERISRASVSEDQKVLNLIVKTDVLGSIDPIDSILETISQEKVVLNILKAEAGDVNLNDIKLAEASNAIVISFRTKTPNKVLEIANAKKVRILSFELIYDLVEDLRKSMKRILAPEKARIDLGKLRTLLIFKTDAKKQVIGAKVLEGEIRKGTRLEIVREDEMIGRGRVMGLQKNKQELDKGTKGEEVGILYEGDVEIQENDTLLVFEEKKQEVEL